MKKILVKYKIIITGLIFGILFVMIELVFFNLHRFSHEIHVILIRIIAFGIIFTLSAILQYYSIQQIKYEKKRVKVEQKLKDSEHNLAERVKELTCLYELSKLVGTSVISHEDILYGVLKLIPPAWQFPDITTAQIIYGNRVFALENFRETVWKLSTKAMINKIPMSIKVYYLEDKPFLKEESDLIREIIVRLKAIMEEREIQVELKESEEKYNNLFQYSNDAIILHDFEGNILEVNDRASELFNYSKEEFLTLSTPMLSSIEEQLKRKVVSEEFSKKGLIKFEFNFTKKNGRYFPAEVSSRATEIKGRKLIQAVIRDITDRKQKEKEIFDLAQFPSEDPYPILRVNKTEVLYINDAGQKLLNTVEHSQIPNIFQESVKNAFDSNQITESEAEFDKRIYSFTITPVKDADYVNIYGMDITERKHVEEKLKEVNKLKSEFLRRASHELKTPLISIKGFSDLILSLYEDQLDTPIISKLREINDGCERLQDIINNLLKTSRLESPDLKPKVQKEDLSFLIKFCANELESLAEIRNQSIELNIYSELYANIEKEEIHDVLSNLLSNAIKYTPPNGKIEIKTELKEDSVVISVIDNGIGFTEEQKEKIFQQFGKIERYGQGLDLGIDGTGLGLYISKKIVESHGGEIWMESAGKNKGSTFYFTLPTTK